MIEESVIAGLAATRAVRAWRYETIGEKPREAVMAVLARPVMHRNGTVNVRATMTKEWLAELLDCPHCLGFWTTVVSVVALRSRHLRPLVLAFAGSMILSAMVQWYPGFSFEEPEDTIAQVEVTLKDDDS